ncbi:GNAT family N-acetyltransferase [Streptomyces sp. NPDC101393]|uniref:GNAT family N-acetyltransferase n=1 Tax=Streptomyces sp. NPDC101393 TaxID=3366141 RepID=UPI00382C6481
MIISRAEEADLPRLLKFRTDAASWLAPLGIDQWSNSFPAENILASIRAGEVYMIRASANADACATVTLDQDADARLWTPEERAEPSRYVHKLTVDRQFAGTGLGTRILNWAGDQAAQEGVAWLRLDAWTTNPKLHAYYTRHGFQHVRTVTDAGVVSGWVAQRPARLDSSHNLHQVPDEEHVLGLPLPRQLPADLLEELRRLDQEARGVFSEACRRERPVPRERCERYGSHLVNKAAALGRWADLQPWNVVVQEAARAARRQAVPQDDG